MDKDFVQIGSAQKLCRVINIRHIVQIVQRGEGWQVFLTGGDSFTLDPSEVEQLFKRLPGMSQEAVPPEKPQRPKHF
jgi:hypothetical protein